MDRVRVEQLLRFLDARYDEIVGFAAELVRTPSPNPPGDERAVAELVAGRLEAFGLHAELVARSPARANLVARLRGEEMGRRLLYNGHLDTKPPGDLSAWRTDPYRPTIMDGRMHGLGACDMKGQVAALVYALAALQETQAIAHGEITLALTADEEAGGGYGAPYLVQQCDLAADAAIVAEPSSIHHDWESLCVLSRGFSGFWIQVYGTQAHDSLSDSIPMINAAQKMAHVLSRMARDFRPSYRAHPLYPKGATVNAGVMVKAGIFWAMCPPYAEFATDVRTLPGMSLAQLQADVEQFLDELRREDPELQVRAVWEKGSLAWSEGTEIPSDAPIIQASLRACDLVLGKRPQLAGFPGGSDAAIFARQAGIPTVPAFGPGLLPLAHNPNEYISVESILQAAKIYAITALLYCG